MPRPRCCRRVAEQPPCKIFKPAGLLASTLNEVVLSIDEFEAIRLADFEGLYHEKAAERMNVSRQTFGRIVETARNKIARVLVEGISLRIDGGQIQIKGMCTFKCQECQHEWRLARGTGRPEECPACMSGAIQRCEKACRPLNPAGKCRRAQSGDV